MRFFHFHKWGEWIDCDGFECPYSHKTYKGSGYWSSFGKRYCLHEGCEAMQHGTMEQ